MTFQNILFYLIFLLCISVLKKNQRFTNIILFSSLFHASYNAVFYYPPCFSRFRFYPSFFVSSHFLCFSIFSHFFSKFNFSIVFRQHFVQENVRYDDESVHFCAISNLCETSCMFGYCLHYLGFTID